MAFGIDDVLGGLLNVGFDSIRQGWASDEATAARDFSAQQAQANRDFQERMRASQYQTAVKDMQAAGLNPMLAYSQGGAGTPSGSMGSTVAAGAVPQGNYFTGTSAAQVTLLEAEADKAKAEAEATRRSFPSIDLKPEQMRAEIDATRQNIEKMREEIKLLGQQRETSAATAENIRTATKKLNVEIPNVEQTFKLLRAQTVETLTRSGLNESQAKKIFQELQANLPEMERQLSAVRKTLLEAELPGAINRQSIDEGIGGPLAAIADRLGIVQTLLGYAVGRVGGGGSSAAVGEGRDRWRNPPKGK